MNMSHVQKIFQKPNWNKHLPEINLLGITVIRLIVTNCTINS